MNTLPISRDKRYAADSGRSTEEKRPSRYTSEWPSPSTVSTTSPIRITCVACSTIRSSRHSKTASAPLAIGTPVSRVSHSPTEKRSPASPQAGSQSVRRAEDWIRANIDRSFAVADIAAAAGTSLRSLQEGVRRERRTTLSAMIESIRLERFHSALADPEGRGSVTEIAGMVGLGHLGRAAAAYRRRYGETPSETLRRTR